MNAMAKGVAHISFAGGGVFLPARSPYDRQVLAEHVGERVQAKGQVQVLLDDQRWIVRRNRDPLTAHCAKCGTVATTASYFRAREDISYCAVCALGTGTDVDTVQPERVSERRVG